jgi:hypothetical protein
MKEKEMNQETTDIQKSHTRNAHIAQQLHGATFVVVVWYRYADIIQLAMQDLLAAIADRPNTYVLIIHNDSPDPAVRDLFYRFEHPQCMCVDLPFNFGKTLAANFFFRKYIHAKNLPATVVSMDPDVLFSKSDFNQLIDASEALPECGMLGMRYTNNNCNPERNLWFPAKKLTGKNQKKYYISCPFLCTVAGPLFAVSGEKLLNHCGNRLFPADKTSVHGGSIVYGGSDSALYEKLRWKYKNGYINGLETTHMQSGIKRSVDVAALLAQRSPLIP